MIIPNNLSPSHFETYGSNYGVFAHKNFSLYGLQIPVSTMSGSKPSMSPEELAQYLKTLMDDSPTPPGNLRGQITELRITRTAWQKLTGGILHAFLVWAKVMTEEQAKPPSQGGFGASAKTLAKVFVFPWLEETATLEELRNLVPVRESDRPDPLLADPLAGARQEKSPAGDLLGDEAKDESLGALLEQMAEQYKLLSALKTEVTQLKQAAPQLKQATPQPKRGAPNAPPPASATAQPAAYSPSSTADPNNTGAVMSILSRKMTALGRQTGLDATFGEGTGRGPHPPVPKGNANAPLSLPQPGNGAGRGAGKRTGCPVRRAPLSSPMERRVLVDGLIERAVQLNSLVVDNKPLDGMLMYRRHTPSGSTRNHDEYIGPRVLQLAFSAHHSVVEWVTRWDKWSKAVGVGAKNPRREEAVCLGTIVDFMLKARPSPDLWMLSDFDQLEVATRRVQALMQVDMASEGGLKKEWRRVEKNMLSRTCTYGLVSTRSAARRRRSDEDKSEDESD